MLPGCFALNEIVLDIGDVLVTKEPRTIQNLCAEQKSVPSSMGRKLEININNSLNQLVGDRHATSLILQPT